MSARSEKQMSEPKAKTVHGDTRGAVLVEFLVALMPLMITFFSFVQLGQIATARLVVKHSAIVATRGAAVISNGNKNTPDQKKGDNKEDVVKSVKAAMGPWAKTMKGDPTVDINDKSGCGEKAFGLVTVTITTDYKCSVPFGGFIVCGANGGVHRIKQTYSFPHQGASYHDGEGSDCKESE